VEAPDFQSGGAAPSGPRNTPSNKNIFCSLFIPLESAPFTAFVFCYPFPPGKSTIDAEEIARYPVVVKENPATYLVSDAEFALQSARAARERNEDEATPRFARMAILLYALSLEAFISFVYEYSEVQASIWTNLSLKDKWLRAARECLSSLDTLETDDGSVYRRGDPIETFREDGEPFLSFLELKQFRNRVVHLKPPFVYVSPEEVDRHLEREEYYPISGLPKLLQHCRLEHAETAKEIYRAMTQELDRQIKGTIGNLFETKGGAWVESICEDNEGQDESSAQ